MRAGVKGVFEHVEDLVDFARSHDERRAEGKRRTNWSGNNASFEHLVTQRATIAPDVNGPQSANTSVAFDQAPLLESVEALA